MNKIYSIRQSFKTSKAALEFLQKNLANPPDSTVPISSIKMYPLVERFDKKKKDYVPTSDIEVSIKWSIKKEGEID